MSSSKVIEFPKTKQTTYPTSGALALVPSESYGDLTQRPKVKRKIKCKVTAFPCQETVKKQEQYQLIHSRWYDPQARRFISPDPALTDPMRKKFPATTINFSPLDFHPYQFARNNPIRFRDPMGEDVIGPIRANELLNGVDVKQKVSIKGPSFFDHLDPNVFAWGLGAEEVNNNGWFMLKKQGWVRWMQSAIGKQVCREVKRRQTMGLPDDEVPVLVEEMEVRPYYGLPGPHGIFWPRKYDPSQNETVFGDAPQGRQFADKVLGRFTFAVAKTNGKKVAVKKDVSGKTVWEVDLIIRDGLGLNRGDPANDYDIAKYFPQRSVIRARWNIQVDCK